MRNLIFAAVALACLAGAAPAQAQYYYYRDDGPSWRFWAPREDSRFVNCRTVNSMPGFRQMDRNNDGRLSGWEFRRMGFGWNSYSQLDLNGNGIVSHSELYAAKRSCD